VRDLRVKVRVRVGVRAGRGGEGRGDERRGGLMMKMERVKREDNEWVDSVANLHGFSAVGRERHRLNGPSMIEYWSIRIHTSCEGSSQR
jgi:hypothetical protein